MGEGCAEKGVGVATAVKTADTQAAAGAVCFARQGRLGLLLTGAVEERLGVLGQLVVNHQVDVGDVEAAGGDVGGDQHRELVVAERGQHLLALALAHVAVQRAAGEVPRHRGGHLVRLALGLCAAQGRERRAGGGLWEGRREQEESVAQHTAIQYKHPCPPHRHPHRPQ